MLGFLSCRTDKNLWVKAGSQKKSPERGLFKLPNQDSKNQPAD